MPTSAPVRLAAICLFLTACSHAASPPLPIAPSCNPGSAYDGTTCRVYAVRSVERMPTPWIEGGRALTLELVIYRPLGTGPYPTLIFHHGSTGNGDNPSRFGLTFTSESIARTFVDRGWMVLFPQRRGRGASDGVYDEGFEPDRSRYSCRESLALAGLAHALEDADVILQSVRARADVDPARLLVGGQSRGGILATAHAARQRGAYRGVLNFVGGWLGEGCIDAVAVNRTTFAAAAIAAPPSLWLYGENDPFYSNAHSRANFEAFIAAGGVGAYRLLRRSVAGQSGHLILNEPALWLADVQGFMAQAER